MGGFAVYQHPMALVRELARRGRRDLTVIGAVNGNDVDLPAGAGCLRRVESSYVGPNFRRRVERGELEMVDYPELLSFDRFRASQDRLRFWPCDYLGGARAGGPGVAAPPRRPAGHPAAAPGRPALDQGPIAGRPRAH
ncbi:MAG: CoA-transferase [Candidatus Rokuibacteriota bacterium]